MIIAEAGVNHNGDIELAKDLIDAAASAGADYVKFQTFKADNTVTKSAARAAYQNTNLKNNVSQYEMLKGLELTDDMHKELIAYAKLAGINFLSTAFDVDSLVYLKSLDLELAKIPSGEITNLPYLRKAAELFPEIIMSTGMANLEEVDKAFNILKDHGASAENIHILHCHTEYPTQMKDVNLMAMLHIQKELSVNVGYSDHTLGIEIPIAAVALGASVIEKHFTLDRSLPGPDHIASLEPSELKEMITAIKNVKIAISGTGRKEPTQSEIKNREFIRKSIVAARPIKKGQIIKYDYLTMKRPGNGICPMQIDKLVGSKAKRNFDKDELIEI